MPEASSGILRILGELSAAGAVVSKRAWDAVMFLLPVTDGRRKLLVENGLAAFADNPDWLCAVSGAARSLVLGSPPHHFAFKRKGGPGTPSRPRTGAETFPAMH